MAPVVHETDVVVVGAGMAGLCAAVEVQRHDCSVTVLEKGTRAGGSMYLSAGIVYTYDSLARVRDAIPHGNPALQRLVVERKDDDIAWLDDLGVTLREPTGDIMFGSGKQFDPHSFTEHLVDRIETNGGIVELETPMVDLRVSSGRIVGIRAQSPDGTFVQIDAAAVILATGGFQGNETLLETFVTDHPEHLWLRANPWSTGDGMLAAEACGGKTTHGMAGFYGHNLPAPPAVIPSSMFLDAKQAYGVKAIAIDGRGKRFVDESASPYEVLLTQATARRANGRAYYIVDADLYRSQFASRRVAESIDTAVELGGRVATADSLSALGETLSSWGINGEQAVDTVRAFNEAVGAGAGENLDPPRGGHQHPIDAPPFHVVEVQPGITFTMGGIDVDTDMGVLRRSATQSRLARDPPGGEDQTFASIPGLFAAGVDVGNVMHRRYMGGLCVALVTGRVAGQQAAKSS